MGLSTRVQAGFAVVAVAFAAFAWGTSATGCSQTPTFENTGGAGSGSQGTGSGGHGDGGGQMSAASCRACTHDAKGCESEVKACQGDCLGLLTCTMNDPTKVETCAVSFQDGVQGFIALTTCLCKSCEDACGDCKLLKCLDLLKDGDEEAIDCGGSCLPCVGDCHDKAKDNGEVGIDCGGPCDKKCDDGTACVGNSDCSSGFCVDGVCCADACQGTCVACSSAKKGSGKNGVCGPIAAGTDPDSECVSPASDACNGQGACRCHDGTKDGSETGSDCGGSCNTCGGTCSDHEQNGDETDVDCGGRCNNTCAGGKHCAVNGDCVSGSCSGGTCCNPDADATTCAGKCETVNNNCHIPVNCGECTGAHEQCGAVTPNKCDCVDPSACSGHCNDITDVCGVLRHCGQCPGTQACQGTTCVCTDPGACTGKCGDVHDACGNIQHCPGCTPPDTCSAQVANECGCVPHNNCGAHCSGTQPDGCNGNDNCTAGCGGGQVCYNTNCCTPTSKAAACGDDCGNQVVGDGCGGNYTCDASVCGGGDVCHNSSCCTPDAGACDFVECGSVVDACGVSHVCSAANYCRINDCIGSICINNFCDDSNCSGCILPCNPNADPAPEQ